MMTPSCGLWSRKPKTQLLTTHFTSLPKTPFFINSDAFKISATRLGLNKKVAAAVSEEKEMETSDSGTDVFKLPYLEGNSWLWEVGGVKILVDPVLVGNLDFGIPWLYDAAKKFLKNLMLDDLPVIDLPLENSKAPFSKVTES